MCVACLIFGDIPLGSLVWAAVGQGGWGWLLRRWWALRGGKTWAIWIRCFSVGDREMRDH